MKSNKPLNTVNKARRLVSQRLGTGLTALSGLSGMTSLAVLSGCNTATQMPLQGQAPNQSAKQAPVRTYDASDLNWIKLNTQAYKGKQDDIHFVSPAVGWYGNGEGKIYRTDDGGKTWAQQLNQKGTFVRALGFVDEKHGFMGNVGTDYYPGVTDEQALYETTDGGTTWAPVAASRIDSSGANGVAVKGLCAIDVLKRKSIYQGELQDRVIIHAAGRVGGPTFLMRSLDGGKTWRTKDMSPYCAMILDVKFFDENVGIICAATHSDSAQSNALILRTADGGNTWQKVYQSNRLFELTWKASFVGRDIGFVSVQNYNPDTTQTLRVIVKTIDGGRNWQEMPLVNDHKVRQFGIGFVNAMTGWVGATTGGFQTLDGGVTWTPVAMGIATNKIRVVPSELGFVVYAIGVEVWKLVVQDGSLRKVA
jgi:photosystem II stability/assembly factor-like uncharacterized protein